MLPSLYKKINTQNLNQILNKRHQSLILKQPQSKYSNLRNPYVEEMKYKSINYLPESIQPEVLRRKKLKIQTINIDDRSGDSTLQTPQNQHFYYFNRRPKRLYTQQKYKTSNIKKSPLDKLNRIINQYSFKNQDINCSQIKARKINFTQRYDKTEIEYRNLSKNKLNWNVQTVQPFISTLNEINPFFRKLNEIVTICLLKIGNIKCYQQQQIIQKEDYPMKKVGIILWGQVLLKSSNNSLKIYLFSGDSINQEILFNYKNKDRNAYQKINIKKGTIPIKQNAKAKTKAGILFLTKKQYQTIFQQLVKIGQKANIIIVENMMRWSFSKKKTIRTQFSHI